MSAATGIGVVLLLIFMSRPLMAYLSRQLCYSMYPTASYWPNPLRGLWTDVSSVYTCEWMAHWGFNWHEVFSWLATSWHVIISTLGGAGGFYALASKFSKHPKTLNTETVNEDQLKTQVAEASTLINGLNRNQVTQLFEAIHQGTLPMHAREKAKSKQNRTPIGQEGLSAPRSKTTKTGTRNLEFR